MGDAPSDREMQDAVARALMADAFGDAAEMFFAPPEDATPGQRIVLGGYVLRAQSEANAAIAALRKIGALP